MNAPNPSRRRLRGNLIIGGIITLLFLLFLRHHTLQPSLRSTNLQPANSTLGFGGLYVVSRPASPRKEHLLEAAYVTELDLTIPDQVNWSEEDIRAFQIPDHESSTVLLGSVMAWLSHHLVLKSFLESGQETALIMEDDVDWDIRLRTEQIPLAQNAARSLLKSGASDPEQYPWAHPNDWDLLYIGHCGDYFGDINDGVGVGHVHPEDLDRLPHVTYKDPTMLWRTDLHQFTASLLTAFHIPEETRVFHRSQWPLCTFGYAVNRRSARRIMDKIAPAREIPERHTSAYDVAVMAGCREGDLNCYTLQPELFHHMEGESLIATAEADLRTIHRPPVDAMGLEQARHRGETPNIGCGFWSGDFYSEGDDVLLDVLREEVGRQGKCLKEEKTYLEA